MRELSEGGREAWASRYGMNKSGDERYSTGRIVHGPVMGRAVTGGSHLCGERSIMCREIESLRCTPESDVTLCVNRTSVKKKEREREAGQFTNL